MTIRSDSLNVSLARSTIVDSWADRQQQQLPPASGNNCLPLVGNNCLPLGGNNGLPLGGNNCLPLGGNNGLPLVGVQLAMIVDMNEWSSSLPVYSALLCVHFKQSCTLGQAYSLCADFGVFFHFWCYFFTVFGCTERPKRKAAVSLQGILESLENESVAM